MIAFSVLNIFDILVTIPGISLFARGIEINPLIQWLLSIDPAVVVVYKLGLNALFIAASVLAARQNFRFALKGVYVVFFAYSLFAIWNLIGIML